MQNYPPTDESLLNILRKLRAPDGCPWDRKQTRHSLIRHLDGECAELIDAISKNDSANIREELGDVLMNLFFQVVIAEENHEFTLEDVYREIIDKMIRRHAHVFGDAHAETPEEVASLWQKIKAGEKTLPENEQFLLDEVKLELSPLVHAEKLQKKAAEAGFDWQNSSGIIDKISEEVQELRSALENQNDDEADEELGDLLFAVINLIRFRKRLDTTEILRRASCKFITRFNNMEKAMRNSGENLDNASVDTMNKFWNLVKNQEKNQS